MTWRDFGWFVIGVACSPFLSALAVTAVTILRNAWKRHKEQE